MEGIVINPKIIFYKDTDACRCDNYIVLPKTTPLNEVIKRCFDEKK